VNNFDDDNLAKELVEQLAHADSNGGKFIHVGDIADKFAIGLAKIQRITKSYKIITDGERSSEINDEDAEKIITWLLYIHPETKERLKNEISSKTIKPVATPNLVTTPATQRTDLKTLIEKFIIVDGSNVLHWMKDNNMDNKVNLIPLLIVLTALKRKSFNFCCYFDASQRFQLEEQQPQQYQEFKKLWKGRDIFSIVPGGESADDYILLDAKNSNRKVLTNDRFRDNKIRLPENKFIKGAVTNCQVLIPKLEIIESMVLDLRKVVNDLQKELK
jgi:Zc3h12a-like Ribonuclease NYN domain